MTLQPNDRNRKPSISQQPKVNVYVPLSVPYCRHSSHAKRERKPATIPNIDVTQQIVSLRARLGFARFKLNQGWEKSNLFDVEQLWRQKQQNSINSLPRPRFTQQDIIDKRAYIHSSGVKQAKGKKGKLVRTLSNPTDYFEGSASRKNQRLHFHHYNRPDPKQTQTVYGSPELKAARKYSSSEDSFSTTDDEKTHVQPLKIKNTLDYLSYAIAMTEADDTYGVSSQPLPDVSNIEPNLIEDDKTNEGLSENDQVDDLSIVSKLQKEQMTSPPTSPVTSAAKAMMMFVSNHTTSP